MKQNLLKTMLVSTALVASTMGVWADNGIITYYSQDYEGENVLVGDVPFPIDLLQVAKNHADPSSRSFRLRR